MPRFCTPHTVIFSSKDDNSTDEPVTGVSTDDGKLTVTLAIGSYFVLYDYDTSVLGYYISDTSEINVTKDTKALPLYLVNNNPDGSTDRPYALSVGENIIELPAGTAYHYIVYRAVKLFVTVEGEGVKVVYGENEYTPNDGVIVFDLLGADTNSVEGFVIENTLDAETAVSVVINSVPGTSGNPLVIETLGEEISKGGLTSNDIVYYSYTATKSGTLTITVISEATAASMINSRNSVAVSTESEQTNVIELEVEEGDVIIIDFATTVKENATITFIADYRD